jgi:hypothetical protein
MKELLERCSYTDLIDLVRRNSQCYRDSESFQVAMNYLMDTHPDELYVKYVLYCELCAALGEDMAEMEVERIFESREVYDTGKLVRIDHIDYQVIESEEFDPFERMGLVKPGQAVRYYDKYMYRTESGEARACYADNPSNNWGV